MQISILAKKLVSIARKVYSFKLLFCKHNHAWHGAHACKTNKTQAGRQLRRGKNNLHNCNDNPSHR